VLSKKGPRFFSKAGLGKNGEGGDGKVAKRKRVKDMPFNAGNRSSLIAGELGREVTPVPWYLKAIFRVLSFPGQIIRGLEPTLSGLLRTPQGLQSQCRYTQYLFLWHRHLRIKSFHRLTVIILPRIGGLI